MVAYTCNPALRTLRQEDNQKFEASLGYRARHCHKKKSASLTQVFYIRKISNGANNIKKTVHAL